MASKDAKPEEFVMNPILAVHTQVDDLTIEVDELKKVADTHTKLLTAIYERDTEILKEQRARRPKGKVLRKKGSALTTDFFIIDTNKEIGPGLKARSYLCINDGPNNIFVGFNVAYSPQLDASPEDIVSDPTRFDELFPGEKSEEGFDTEEIYSLHIMSDPSTGLGPSTFRAKMVY